MSKNPYSYQVPELQGDPKLNEPVFDAFTEGVAMGGLRSKNDIMLLICYLLKKLGKPVSINIIVDVMQGEQIANYFEAMNAVAELVENGNLTLENVDGVDYLSVTTKGINAVSVVEEDLPRSIRETAFQSAVHYQTIEQNSKDNHVKIESVEDGYQVSFSMTDKDLDLMKLSIFVADRDQAETLKNNFIEDPVRLYSAILSALMVD